MHLPTFPRLAAELCAGALGSCTTAGPTVVAISVRIHSRIERIRQTVKGKDCSERS